MQEKGTAINAAPIFVPKCDMTAFCTSSYKERSENTMEIKQARLDWSRACLIRPKRRDQKGKRKSSRIWADASGDILE